MEDFRPSQLANLNEEAPSYSGPMALNASHSSKTSSSSSLHLTSTPKQHPTLGHTNLKLGHSSSSGSLQISDTEEEENNNNSNIQTSNDRLNSLARQKKCNPSKFTSRSLPVTPRINGSITNVGALAFNGASPIPSLAGVSTPLLMAPHLTPHLSMEGSYHSIGSLSPSNSQYATCSSGFLSESHEKVLPGSIDYSSLPLPKDESFRVSQKRNISRHLSEPSIHQAGSKVYTVSGKYSCPLRKSSLKGRKHDFCQSKDSEILEGIVEGTPPPVSCSLNGIEQKLDELENMGMQWKFIQTLVDELNSCRAQNNRMAIELHQAKLEIQMLKSSFETHSDNIQPSMLSEMVGQIHAAQKFRDEAMMSRIKLANEERDAAITHSRSLLERLGLSPRAEFNQMENLNLRDQKFMDSSPNPSNLNEEIKAIRLALSMQETLDGRSDKDACHSPNSNQTPLDELKAKLCQSEASRWQLHERCARMEGIFDMIRRKCNGLSNLESMNANPVSLQMDLFGTSDSPKKQSGSSNPSSNDTPINKLKHGNTCNRKPESELSTKLNSRRTSSSSASDADQKDNTLSSLESVETASISSLKKLHSTLTEHEFNHSDVHSQPTSESVFILNSTETNLQNVSSTEMGEINIGADLEKCNSFLKDQKSLTPKLSIPSLIKDEPIKNSSYRFKTSLSHSIDSHNKFDSNKIHENQTSKCNGHLISTSNHITPNHVRKQEYLNDIITIKGPITEL